MNNGAGFWICVTRNIFSVYWTVLYRSVDVTPYWRDNWDGWPLHSAIAFVLMLPAVSNSYPLVMFFLNLVFWPAREAWQHDGFHNIWTPHRIAEWGAPILVSLGMLLLW